MASPNDLVTLAVVKAWIGIAPATTTSDASLGLLISQISRKILSEIQRNSILPKQFTEIRDGNGKSAMMLKNFPINSYVSLSIDGNVIPAAPSLAAGVSPQSGYVLEQVDPEPPSSVQSLMLRGFRFTPGFQNVVHTYVAGYQITAEQAVAAAAVTVQQPYGAWGSDLGVKNAATGAALTKVTGAPAVGQYQVSATVVGGYVFNAGDVGTAVLFSYGYVPADLAQACLEWIAERWAYKSRVGEQSKSLGGQETVSFAITNTPNFILSALADYMRVAPL